MPVEPSKRKYPVFFIVAMLASIGLSLAILNGSAFDKGVLPAHDTLYSLSGFATFAKHLRQYGDLPLWRPYSTFGAPSDWMQLQLLSPASCVFATIGAIAPSLDLVFLFKLSLLAEQIVFAGACVWLAFLIFRNFYAILFFSVSSILTTFCWFQVFMNLRWVSGLPWILIFLFLAFRRSSRPLLVLSLLSTGIIIYGTSYYTAVPYLLVWILSFLCLIRHEVKNRSELRWLWRLPTRAEALPLLSSMVFCALAGISIALQLWLVKAHQTPLSPGRNSETGGADLATFLSYGMTFDIGSLYANIAYGIKGFASHGMMPDLTLYLGVPILAFAFVGIRHPGAMSNLFGLLAIVFGSLSISGLAAFALYYVPGCDNFRHISYLAVFLRFALCGLAAYGIEMLLPSLSRREAGKDTDARKRFYFIIVLALLIYSIPLENLVPSRPLEALAASFAPRIALSTAVVAALIVWIGATKVNLPTAAPLLLVGLSLAGLAMVNGKISQQFGDKSINYEQIATEFSAPILPIMHRPSVDAKLAGVLDKLKSAENALYDPLDSAINRDKPLDSRCDVLPSESAMVIKLFGQKPGLMQFRSFGEGPKTFIASVPIDSTSEHPSQERNIILKSLGNDSRTIYANRIENTEATLASFDFNHVTFRTASLSAPKNDTDYFLVYADNYHSEWLATTQEEKLDVWLVNGMFKAVKISQPEQVVTFRFGSSLRRYVAWSNFLIAGIIFVAQTAILLVGFGTGRFFNLADADCELRS